MRPAGGGSGMSRHVPFDPWPDVRWESLTIVGGLVIEVPNGWTARDGGVGRVVVERADGVVTIELDPLDGRLVDHARSALVGHEGALVLEATEDRVLVVVPTPADTFVHDDRLVDDRGARVRVTLGCSAHDWPGASALVDGLLDSRWHVAGDDPGVPVPDLAGVGGGPRLQWVTHPDVLDHLVRLRGRGIVPASARRSEVGVSARALGFVGRFGGVTDKGDEVIGPVIDHDAVLTVEASDPARPGEVGRWTCWLQGRRCLVRASNEDGSSSLGIIDVGSIAAHLLVWIGLDRNAPAWSGEPVTISAAQYEERSGACPSDVEWFRAAWAVPSWRSVHGWSHEARAGVWALIVPGVGALRLERGPDGVTLQPIRNAEVARNAVEAVNALAAVTRERFRG